MQRTLARMVLESFDLKENWGQPDNKHVGWKAIEKAERLGEDLLFLEDDAFPADSTAISDAMNHMVPARAPSRRSTGRGGRRPACTTSGIFMMSQAVKIPVRSFAHLLAWRRVSSGDWEAISGFDTALAAAGHSSRWLYEQTERNHFNHLGVVSAVRNNPTDAASRSQ